MGSTFPGHTHTNGGDHELRVRNVSLHRQGKVVYGSLSLRSHHLVVSYQADSDGAIAAAKQPKTRAAEETTTVLQPGLSTDRSTLTAETQDSQDTAATREVSVTPHSGNNAGSPEAKRSHAGHGMKGMSHDVRRKPQTKHVWIPYPLINHCILRPSNSQSGTTRLGTSETGFKARQEDDDLFPPTCGTSSMTRPSTDSTRLAPSSSPHRPASPSSEAADITSYSGSARQPAIRVRCKDFTTFALHFHASTTEQSPDEVAREVFFVLQNRSCVDKVEALYAFHFQPPAEELSAGSVVYDARKEFARMGISGKSIDGPGTAWRITDINCGYSYSPTYPAVLAVPRAVSDNMLKYGGAFRSRARIPALAYLHTNGGSITRSSQPMVGVQGKRNPQDERLVSAIFSSHTPTFMSPEDSPPQGPAIASPSTTTLDSGLSDAEAADADVPGLRISQSDVPLEHGNENKATALHKKVYGSTRRNLIVDARPMINMLANKAAGGGIEDVANYMGTSDMPVERVFLNIANVHVMRGSLEKVVESLGNSDYLSLPPDQEALRRSGWQGHIAGLLEGAEMVARVVGLGGSHVLIHCSDGWDRTSQISALAQVMLDPYYRTLEGMITLIQKDFLSFGHKFRDRIGLEGSEKWFEIENERIQPTRKREQGSSGDSNSLNALGSKALSGARNWLEKNRGSLFKQQNASHDSLEDKPSSRPTSPPPNPVIHAPPVATSKVHKKRLDEIAPIFHQLLDAVYQLMRQKPNAFEFNERFLRKLLYQAYASQYGEFLFNNEQERVRYQGRTASVWPFFLARRAEFTSQDYVAEVDDPLLFPQRHGYEREVDVKWWHELFGRKDEEMNVPTLASQDPPLLQPRFSFSVSLEDSGTGNAEKDASAELNRKMREAKSTPSLSTLSESVAARFNSLKLGNGGMKAPEEETHTPSRPPMHSRETDFEVLERYAGSVQAATATNGSADSISRTEPPITEDSEELPGDPLGVSRGVPQAEVGRLDFTTFAQQNAFRDT